LTLATVFAVVTPGVSETPLRVVLGLPFVLFLPGYALIAALFPEAGVSPHEDVVHEGDAADGDPAAEPSEREGIDGIERVALSFGLSIAVVPLVGLVLNFTPFGIRLAPILASVSGLTLLLTAVAARRRRQLPEEEQFRVPYRDWLAAGRSELFEPDSQMDAALNVLLALSVVLAAASVTYAVAVPKQGESFSELYLLTEQENGSLVADDYPTEFTVGESQPLVVGVGNHEHRAQSYTLVVEIQDVRIANNSTTVLADRELRRLQTEVANGEDWRQRLDIAPTMTGERLRLAFMLYKGEAPAAASAESAYREVHLWVNVSQSEQAAVSAPARLAV
jgi:uncharacterized membrane protein